MPKNIVIDCIDEEITFSGFTDRNAMFPERMNILEYLGEGETPKNTLLWLLIVLRDVDVFVEIIDYTFTLGLNTRDLNPNDAEKWVDTVLGVWSLGWALTK